MDKDIIIENYILAKNSIQLKDVKLEKMFFEKFEEPEGNVTHDLNLGYKVDTIDQKIVGFFNCQIKSIDHKGKQVAIIDIVYKGNYEIIDETKHSIEDGIKFAELQTVPQLIPYCRSLILFLSSQMFDESIHLPTMDIIESLIKND